MMMGGQDAKEADQAGRLVQVGLDMLQHARSIKHPTRPGSLEVSVAIHTGRVRFPLADCMLRLRESKG